MYPVDLAAILIYPVGQRTNLTLKALLPIFHQLHIITITPRKIDIVTITTRSFVSSSCVHHNIVGMLHSWIERNRFLAHICSVLIDVVSSQKYLRIVSRIILDEPILSWIVVIPLTGAVTADPFQVVVLNLSVILCSGVSPPFFDFHMPRYFDQIRTHHS